MKNKKYIIKNKTVSSRSAVLFFIFIIIFSTIIFKLAYLQLYSNNKKKQKKYNENLMKSNNYYAEKDKYLLKMIDFLDEKTTESYFIDMNSKRLNNSLFEIVVKDVDFAIFHSMNIEILQKLKEKNIFIDEIRISKINDYVNTNI